eukprot:329107-Chlamydomonas_euryale.AAC.4
MFLSELRTASLDMHVKPPPGAACQSVTEAATSRTCYAHDENACKLHRSARSPRGVSPKRWLSTPPQLHVVTRTCRRQVPPSAASLIRSRRAAALGSAWFPARGMHHAARGGSPMAAAEPPAPARKLRLRPRLTFLLRLRLRQPLLRLLLHRGWWQRVCTRECPPPDAGPARQVLRPVPAAEDRHSRVTSTRLDPAGVQDRSVALGAVLAVTFSTTNSAALV